MNNKITILFVAFICYMIACAYCAPIAIILDDDLDYEPGIRDYRLYEQLKQAAARARHSRIGAFSRQGFGQTTTTSCPLFFCGLFGGWNKDFRQTPQYPTARLKIPPDVSWWPFKKPEV